MLQARPSIDVRDSGAYIVFYDGSCALCRRTRAFLERHARNAAMRFVDSTDPAVMARWPGIDPAAARTQVLVLDPQRHLHAGYDAAVALMTAAVRPLRLVRPLLTAPPVRWIGQRVYDRIARRRHCRGRPLG